MLRIEKLMKRDLISVRSDETAFGASLLMRVRDMLHPVAVDDL